MTGQDQTEPSSNMNLALAIGQLQGQVGALAESMTRKMHSDEDLTAAVAKLQNLPNDVSDLKHAMQAMDTRLKHIETRTSQQDGAATLVGVLMKSPAMGWLVGAATAAWAYFTGRLG